LKIKNKIAITVIPIMIISIVLINIIFGIFFQNYVLAEEENQIKVIESSLYNFINEKSNKYLGTVNDWSHWDDTYEFAKTNNTSYIKDNLPADTYSNLDANFIIIKDKNGKTLYNKYFNLSLNEFTNFPTNFLNDLESNVGIFNSYEDESGIICLGNKFYFFAKSCRKNFT
jgi:sensor domain CHASE-containing protein